MGAVETTLRAEAKAARAARLSFVETIGAYVSLTKPRVIQLIVFCALIGMVLAVPGLPSWAQVQTAALACLGIWLVAGAAAAFNCVVEQQIDAKMRRTAPPGDPPPRANWAMCRRLRSRPCCARSVRPSCTCGSTRSRCG